MSVNRERPHVYVLPEDDANRQLAVNFLADVDWTRQRQMQVLPSAGGWRHVLEVFKSEHAAAMERWPARLMVLLIDFDNDATRLAEAKRGIPESLLDRVFVLGVLSEPEKLKVALGTYGEIGSLLAKDCRDGTSKTWEHQLLQHNESELERLRGHIYPILFDRA